MPACKKCRSCTFSTRHFSRLLGALATKLSTGLVDVGCYTQVRTTCVRAKASACVRYTSECPVFQHGFLEKSASHSYDSIASYSLLAYAHIDWYPTVDDPWACYGAFQRKRPTTFLPLGSHCGICGHVVGSGLHTINVDTPSEGKCTQVFLVNCMQCVGYARNPANLQFILL